MRYLVLFAARLVIGGLFLYASLYKIQDPAAFAVSIRNYGILPADWSNVAALTLPWIEIIAGSFLILGIHIKPSALLTTGMLAVFFGGRLLMRMRQDSISTADVSARLRPPPAE